ncbi:tetraspanin-8 [Lucilia cuprina]|uniref:tetraspanin-8 n=1 Tax=Lucilia cuprina TaxID=7375 RepID=UPI001F05F1D8|nr:tetraspanin-8 [Lucilia cuprina]
MPSCRSCLQWTIIIFNTSCVIFGILGVVESVFELQKYNYGSPDFTEKIVQIVIGTVLVISAFIGCCGAVHGSVKMLILFITILFALIAAHIWKLWRYDELRVRTTTEVMVSYTWVEEVVERGKMNPLQETYTCCGKHGYIDYINNFMKVPDSCYHYENNKKSYYPHEEGCISAVSRAYLSIYRMETWAHISLIGFEILGIILSIVLICNLTADTLRYSY